MIRSLFHHARKITAYNAAEKLHIAHQLISSLPFAGLQASRKSGTGEQFWQFRQYTPDDPRKAIDWRRTARSDAPVIRQKEEDRAIPLYLWCDPNPGMDINYHPKRLHKSDGAHILSLAVGLLAIHQHNPVYLMDGTAQAPVARSENALNDLAVMMDSKRSASFDTLLNIVPPSSGLITLASDFLYPAEQIEAVLKHFSRPNVQLIILHILDPDEINLPYTGRVLFRNAGETDRHAIENIADIKTAYAQKISTHIDALTAVCARYHGIYVQHVMDMELEKSLTHILNGLHERAQNP